MREFAAMVDTAIEVYAERVKGVVQKLGVVGTIKNIYGGKDRDEVVGKERVWSPTLTALEAKRVSPDYRDGGFFCSR